VLHDMRRVHAACTRAVRLHALACLACEASGEDGKAQESLRWLAAIVAGGLAPATGFTRGMSCWRQGAALAPFALRFKDAMHAGVKREATLHTETKFSHYV